MRSRRFLRSRASLAAFALACAALAFAGAPSAGRTAPHGAARAAVPLALDALLQQAKLTAADTAGGSAFGFDVALSADGNTAVVGGPFDDGDRGAVWFFARSGTTWTQLGDKFRLSGEAGFSVAISADGGIALAGAPNLNNGGGGVVSFRRSAGQWQQFGGTLTPAGAQGAASFGSSVALSSDGSTAVVGGPDDDGGAGGIWAFTYAGPIAGWFAQGAKLTAGGAAGLAGLGYSLGLSLDGNTLLAGGPFDDDLVGAAWAFGRSGSTWSQQGAKLTGSGEAGPAFFGSSVAVSDDGSIALVGGTDDDEYAGAVWPFARSGSTWSQQGAKVRPTDAGAPTVFGYDLAISGDGSTALVGGPADRSGQGAAWLLTRSGTTWAQQGARLAGSGGIGAGGFGTGVSLSSDGALVGGADDRDGVGAAWAFVAGPPSAPTGVSAAAGSGQATVSFAPSFGATSYTVTATPPAAPASGASSPVVVTGLTNGTSYTFTVTASNSAGASPASAPSNAVTPIGPPGAPTDVTVTAGDGIARVEFTPPPDGGAPILYYTATATGGASANATGSPVVVYGLTNGASYTFTVTATNSSGTGPPSASSDFATPTRAPRPHPEPPAARPRPDVPPFVAPTGPRVPPPD